MLSVLESLEHQENWLRLAAIDEILRRYKEFELPFQESVVYFLAEKAEQDRDSLVRERAFEAMLELYEVCDEKNKSVLIRNLVEKLKKEKKPLILENAFKGLGRLFPTLESSDQQYVLAFLKSCAAGDYNYVFEENAIKVLSKLYEHLSKKEKVNLLKIFENAAFRGYYRVQEAAIAALSQIWPSIGKKRKLIELLNDIIEKAKDQDVKKTSVWTLASLCKGKERSRILNLLIYYTHKAKSVVVRTAALKALVKEVYSALPKKEKETIVNLVVYLVQSAKAADVRDSALEALVFLLLRGEADFNKKLLETLSALVEMDRSLHLRLGAAKSLVKLLLDERFQEEVSFLLVDFLERDTVNEETRVVQQCTLQAIADSFCSMPNELKGRMLDCVEKRLELVPGPSKRVFAEAFMERFCRNGLRLSDFVAAFRLDASYAACEIEKIGMNEIGNRARMLVKLMEMNDNSFAI
mgnify:CR=1 FL=1